MLAIPISFSDMIAGIVTADEVYQTKKALEVQGLRLKYKYDYDSLTLNGNRRCRGCGHFYPLTHDFFNMRGNNELRTSCRDCYRLYSFFKQGQLYVPENTTCKDRAISLGIMLFGGKGFWTYQIEFITKELNRLVYVGFTTNIISRRSQHECYSSNPKVRQLLFERSEPLFAPSWNSAISVYFQVFSWNTEERARYHERELYDRYRDMPTIELLNLQRPIGI